MALGNSRSTTYNVVAYWQILKFYVATLNSKTINLLHTNMTWHSVACLQIAFMGGGTFTSYVMVEELHRQQKGYKRELG